MLDYALMINLYSTCSIYLQRKFFLLF